MVKFELCFTVTADPEKMIPYPTIQNLPAEQRAMRLLENTCAEPLRWLTGVEDVADFKITKVQDERVATDPVGASHSEVGPESDSSKA